LSDENSASKKFLELFKRAKVEFLDSKSGERSTLYQPSVWHKNRSAVGSSFDCLSIERDFPPKTDDSEETEFTVRVSLWLDSTPERFLVSEQL